MLDAKACEKSAHFIALCDAYGLPLIFLWMFQALRSAPPRRNWPRRRSGRVLYELSRRFRDPIVLRKGYGAGYFAMAGGRV